MIQTFINRGAVLYRSATCRFVSSVQYDALKQETLEVASIESYVASLSLVTSPKLYDQCGHASWFSHRSGHLSTATPFLLGVHSSAPIPIRWVDTNQTSDKPMITDQSRDATIVPIEVLNRNARRGKRANAGKRPVSRHRRRAKKRRYGSHRR